MRFFRTAFLVLVTVLYGWAQEAVYTPNEVIVKFAPGASVASASASLSVIESRPVGRTGAYLFRSAGLSTPDLVARLRQRSDVIYAGPNYIIRAAVTPNEPMWGQLWGMQKIAAPSAWDVSTGSQGIMVGVIDSGIDYTHPDLASNVWSAPTAFTVNVGGVQVTCPAGSHGFNAITGSCDPMDDSYDSHGTHVSGTIGAIGNNGEGVVGVNWTTRIIGVKFLDAYGYGTTENAIKAIDFLLAVQSTFGAAVNIRVLSNSWGSLGEDLTLQDHIAIAADNGMLFVAAAGNYPPFANRNNDQVPVFPASYAVPNVIAVAATDSGDGLASFSHYGLTSVHLGAPGVNILSTLRLSGYGQMDGTSMAAPHVSGAAALILSACPSLSTAELKSVILNSVDPVPALLGLTITGGRLNVDQAIQLCLADQNLNNLTFTTGTHVYSAANSITASDVNIDQDASVTFSAGGFIRLLPYFRATAGSAPITFRAYIE